MNGQCPDIATYQIHAVTGAARAARWLAKYVDGGTMLPATFEGATEAEVVRSARAFWASEQISVAKARAARGKVS